MDFFGPLVVRYSTGLPTGRPESAAAGEPAAPAPKGGDINLANIVKLIPAEIVAIYMAARGVVPDTTHVLGLPWPMFLVLVCLVVCVLVRYLATRSAPGGVNWWLVGVSAVAFFLWAHALYPQRPGPVIADFYGSIAGTLAALFGIIAPKFVPAQPDA